MLQLGHIFVIRVCSSGEGQHVVRSYTINHLRPLPLAESAGSDDEENAAALGLVAHLTQTAARILLVPLKHQLEVCASRSSVLDQTSLSTLCRLPLYAKGAEPSAYRRAQRLLGRDIQQLLVATGLPTSSTDEQQLLPNLEVLMGCVRKSPDCIQPW